jgi:hypothetical protein
MRHYYDSQENIKQSGEHGFVCLTLFSTHIVNTYTIHHMAAQQTTPVTAAAASGGSSVAFWLMKLPPMVCEEWATSGDPGRQLGDSLGQLTYTYCQLSPSHHHRHC